MARSNTSTQVRSTKESKVYMTTLGIKLSASQVRSNRFTVFTPSQREALKASGAAERLAKLYGVKVDELFTSTGKVRYQGVKASRDFLNALKKMTARRFTANADAIELARVAYGWTPKRIAHARKNGAGPERKGWAAVHASKKS